MKFYIVSTEVSACFDFCVEADSVYEAEQLAREAGLKAIKGGPVAVDVATYEVRESDEK